MKNSDVFFLPGFEIAGISLADYFGIWQIEENHFRNVVGSYQGIDLTQHIRSAAVADKVDQQNESEYSVTKDGIAMLQINGPMMKSVSSLSNGTSTVRMRQQLRDAQKRSDVKGVFLTMDTPGGTVRGNQDLADEVAAFAAVKPIYAFTEDMTASAGVSVASQATMRFANSPAALYGSMGTYSVMQDMSGRAEQLGIKVHVIKAGEYKGMGEPGTEITEGQLQEAQRVVNLLNENYLNLIARGLGKHVEAIRSYADGRVFSATDATAMGLINGVQSADATYKQLVAATKKTRSTTKPVPGSKKMESEPASLAELKAAFPKSTAEWRESQIEANATLQQAAISYASHVEAKAEAAKAEHEKQLKELKDKAPKGASLGHSPIKVRGKAGGRKQEDGDDEDDEDKERAEYLESGDAIEDFNATVAKIAGPRADFGRRQRAIRTVANRDPELYQAYLLATNPGKRQTRLIQEKMETIVER